jgi:hypothetical protein
MTTELATRDNASSVLESVVIQGDLSKLPPGDRVDYYRRVCESLNLNPYTQPFEYITLNGKLRLYAKKDATDQLRQSRGVSVTRLERERLDELYVVTAYAADKTGRSDSAIGAVNVKGLTGENLANALMKAETKAKRRVTLSLCGLGWTDESEVESIPSAQTVVVDHDTGEVQDDDTEHSDAIQAWVDVCEEADRLGIAHKDLPPNASLEQIDRWTDALTKKVLEANREVPA